MYWAVLTYGKVRQLSLPLGVHNWAQADQIFRRGSVYLDNTNFFKAQTHNLSTIDARCGVEFPLISNMFLRTSQCRDYQSRIALPCVYQRFKPVDLLSFGFMVFHATMEGVEIPSSSNPLAGLIVVLQSIAVFFYAFNFLPDIDRPGTSFSSALAHFVRFYDVHFQIAIRDCTPSAFAGIATLIKDNVWYLFVWPCREPSDLHFLKAFSTQKRLRIGLIVIGLFLAGCSQRPFGAYDYYFFHKVND